MTNNNQIYVGDIPESADEMFITSMFKEFGNIVQGGVILKQHHSLPKKFAFITFEDHESAHRAIQEMNYTKLDGVPIRISWADSETKKINSSGLGNLYIRGLDESIEVAQLHDAFSNFGEITSCRIPLNPDGTSRGYGYIQFRNAEDAEKARNDLQEASINGKAIKIEPYHKPQRTNPDETFTDIFFKPTGYDAELPECLKTEEGVKEFYGKFGKITCVGVTNGKFGFANFESHDDAVQAVSETNGQEISGVKLVVNRKMSKQERIDFLQKRKEAYQKELSEKTKGRNLYVKGFSETITEEQFREYFEQFGKVENTLIKYDPESGQSKGFGYVLFENVEDANACILKGTTTKLPDGKIPYISIFQEKKDREFKKKKELRQRQQNQAAQGTFTQEELQKLIKQYVDQALAAANGTPVPAPASTFGMSPMFPVPSQSPKDMLKNKLLNNDISGKALKEKLISVSDDQAKALCEDEAKFAAWLAK